MFLVCLLFDIYICVGCFVAGTMYKEQRLKNEPAGFNLLLDCLIFGFFGWMFAIKHYLRRFKPK